MVIFMTTNIRKLKKEAFKVRSVQLVQQRTFNFLFRIILKKRLFYNFLSPKFENMLYLIQTFRKFPPMYFIIDLGFTKQNNE